MKKSYILIGILLITVVAISSYFAWHTNQPAQVEDSPGEEMPRTAEEKMTQIPSMAAEDDGKTTEQALQPPMIQYIGPVKPDTSVYSETADIYRTYDDDTLENLAEGGDIMAIKVMATRLMENPPSMDEVSEEEIQQEIKLQEEYEKKLKRYFDLALAYGDTELADYASSMYGRGWRNPRNTQSEIHNALLEKLAFAEFIEMRGDQSQKLKSASFIMESFSRFLGEPVILTEDDKVLIHNRAQVIYNDLEAQREELGLGPFENSE